MKKITLLFGLIFCIIFVGNAQTGKLKTYTSEDWDYWEIDYAGNSGKIKTYTSEDWDYWEYNYAGASGKIKTYTSEDWDYWEVDGSAIKLKTYTSEDWDYWEITGNLSSLNAQSQVAVMFIAIFTSSIKVRGLNN